MTRRLAGAVASLLAMLGGLWLILAPFALGIQPKNTDWTHETITNVWSGIGLGVLGLIGLVTFATALLQHLATQGMITPRKARASSPQPEPAQAMQPEPAQATSEPATQPAPATSTDLDKLIAPLVAALTTDLDRDRDAAQATNSGPAREPALATNNSDRQPTSTDNN
jgi:hypothetical protein